MPYIFSRSVIRTGLLNVDDNYVAKPRASIAGYLAAQEEFHKELPEDIGYQNEDDWEKEYFPVDAMLANAHVFYYYKERVVEPGSKRLVTMNNPMPALAIFQTVLAEGRELEWKLVQL